MARTAVTRGRNGALTFLLMVLCVHSTVSKQCSKTLNRVPVHKNFDLQKFAGEWFTATRTTWAWGTNTLESMTIEILQAEDGTWRFRYSGSRAHKCEPVTETVLVPTDRDGHYLLRNKKKIEGTFIISFTDYKTMAMVLYCFKHARGKHVQCLQDGHQVEILARSSQPNTKTVNSYIKRATKRLCGGVKDFESTSPGFCKIPDILEQARIGKGELENDDSPQEMAVKCGVNSIPLEPDFDLSQMSGLWYEIARTRFTFNKMESVVSYHNIDTASQNMYSYYTGTLVNSNEQQDENPSCMTAIQGMSKTQESSDTAADRLGRIGWDDSTYPWSPTKVVYGDGEYTLFYACYSGPSNQPCPQEYMEVTLVGKDRNIPADRRAQIYSLLPNLCLQPEDMKETEFLADCTGWVEYTAESTETTPESCRLDEIQVVGRWFLYGSIHYNNVTSLQGAVMDRHLEGVGELIYSNISVFRPDPADSRGPCVSYKSRSRDMCINTADFITTLPVAGDGNFVFQKILHIDDFMLVEYVCARRTDAGNCEREGIQFHVYVKRDNTTAEDFGPDIAVISELAESVCLDPEDLQIESSWCEPVSEDGQAAAAGGEAEGDEEDSDEEDADEPQCDLYGYWFEVASSVSGKLFSDVSGAVAYFTSSSNDTLSIYYTGFYDASNDDDDDSGDTEDRKRRDADENDNNDDVSLDDDAIQCSNVQHQLLLARCRSESNGDYLTRFEDTENFISYIPLKVLYTDFSSVLVTYACEMTMPGGQCRWGDANVKVWARNTTLDEDTLDFAYEMIFWACLDPYREGGIESVEYIAGSCLPDLESYVSEHDLYDGLDPEVDETQKDESERELDEIEKAFLLTDDQFYYDSQ
ncbi:hypothetical protein MAR_033041 [Mya arenaria]|uniref:Uncharacterized protein n=1 Tax=Mya arenaria TaxID=6604 RepID=A0ABY7GAM0_MYAAR|nr:hypothetical protein MAR_033041 [Mya arenaria]